MIGRTCMVKSRFIVMDRDTDSSFTPPREDGATITIQLDGFEGPLDLLLHLIKREELDIWDIPIARITHQYLDYLQLMQNLNINVAGEWLVMAATLIYIKSRMLLPPDPGSEGEEETEEDPRAELVYQLLEHQKFKNAAQMLHTREEVENAVWHNPPQDAIGDAQGVVDVSLFDLIGAFNEVVKRFEERKHLEVDQEEVTLEEKISDVRSLLLLHDKIPFSRFFTEAKSRQHLIVTFLAILELVRLKEVRLTQRKVFAEIFIKNRKPKEAGT
jgi:segregation and condensation protein A